MAGPDRPNWNLAKFWGGGRDTAVQTVWRVVMVRLARRDGGWQCESEKKLFLFVSVPNNITP